MGIENISIVDLTAEMSNYGIQHFIQWMTIENKKTNDLLVIYKTKNIFHFEFKRNNSIRKFYRLDNIHLYTFQDLVNQMMCTIDPYICHLTFKLKSLVYFPLMPTKEFMNFRLDQLPMGTGEFIYTKNRRCSFCWSMNDSITKKCANCRCVYYCSKECQVQDWTAYHKHVCYADN
jgi:hypothetical protein